MPALLRYWQAHPLRAILILGLLVRLVSVVFSKGYGMVDDHFVMVHPAQQLLEKGPVAAEWSYPEDDTRRPSKRSVLYPGSIYFTFAALESIGITDPQVKMFWLRLWHALFNLLVPYFGFLIAKRLANEGVARYVGLLLALYWFMPNLSVRNLNEVVCMPLIIGGCWWAIRALEEPRKIKWALLAGIFMGLAFSVRYQNALFSMGVGAAFLWYRQWKTLMLFAVGSIFPAFVIHGLVEGLVLGYPFMGKLVHYVEFNFNNSNKYTVAPFYMYLELLSGILIPPLSLMLWLGFLKSWRHLILFLPALFFIAFHSYFPNKQERFILPMVPLLVTLGWMGWSEIAENWSWALARQKLFRGFMIFFWSLNLLAILFVAPSYSKRSRVESLSFLHEKPAFKAIVFDEANKDGTYLPPWFYLGYEPEHYKVVKKFTPQMLCEALATDTTNPWPEYLVLVNDKDVEQRLENLKGCFPNIEYEALIRPSYLDRLLHWLNPVNKNENIRIYRIGSEKGKFFKKRAKEPEV